MQRQNGRFIHSEDGDTRPSLVETAFGRTYRVTSFDEIFSLMFHIAQSFQLSCLVIVSIFRDWNSQIWDYLTEMKCLPHAISLRYLSTTYFFSSHEIIRSLYFPIEPTIFSVLLNLLCVLLSSGQLFWLIESTADSKQKKQELPPSRSSNTNTPTRQPFTR
jgi:hypothetical protein